MDHSSRCRVLRCANVPLRRGKTAEAGGYEYYSVVSDNRSCSALGSFLIRTWGPSVRSSGSPRAHPRLTFLSRATFSRVLSKHHHDKASWSGVIDELAEHLAAARSRLSLSGMGGHYAPEDARIS